MCTYLNGTLAAFTGTLPPSLMTMTVKTFEVAKKQEKAVLSDCNAPMFSGEREQIRFDDHGYNHKGSRHRCSKYNAGRKAHDHIAHTRRLKAGIKRQII